MRRPTGPHSPFVHRVLQHLTAREFDAAPALRGIDDDGCEVLTFIPGDVPHDLAHFFDHQLIAAARLLRRLHDATADFPSLDADQVVCHGDASPCNHVFREGLPIALIDFDAAHPGSRHDDLGYAAWLWLDLGNTSIDATAQGRRLVLFFDAYGASPTEAIDDVLEAQVALARRCPDARPDIGDWARSCHQQVLLDRARIEAGAADRLVSNRVPQDVSPRPSNRDLPTRADHP